MLLCTGGWKVRTKKRRPMKKWTFLVKYSIILCSLLFFQRATMPPANAVVSHEKLQENSTEQPDPNKLILEGIHLVYDHRFPEAEGVFREVIARSPDLPAGYFYLAMVSWSRLAVGSWSPENVSEFKNRIDMAITKAEKRIEKTGGDSYDYFYFGGALGFKGRFELMKGRWMSSYFLARDAIDALNICQKLDPENKDVLLGLGTFDYYTDRLSGVLKFITSFFLYKGDMKRGLERLNIAAREAMFSSIETKSVLLHIYLFLEQDFEKALPLALELSNTFKNNPHFRLLKGVTFIRMDKDDMYRKTVEEFRRKGLDAKDAPSAAKWERRAQYLELIHDLYHNNYTQAGEKIDLLLVSADPEHDPAMIAWPLLKKGMMYELQGDKNEADKYYNQVLQMENASGAQFIAEKYLKEPLKQGAAAIGY